MTEPCVSLFCQLLILPYLALLCLGAYFSFREIQAEHKKHNHHVSVQAQIRKALILLNVGGFVYVLIELLYRGYSHWTMYLVGGLCFVQLGMVNEVLPWETPIEVQMILGTIIATINEFISGLIINKGFHYQVWDYSDQPFNLFGQICLLFTFYWLLIALFAIVVDDCIKYYFWKEKKPVYYSILFHSEFLLPIPNRSGPDWCDKLS